MTTAPNTAPVAPASTHRTYVEAADVASALAALAAGARPVAGGTDLVVGARHGKAPLPESLVGIHRIPGLSSLDVLPDGGLRIGALVSHAALAVDPRVLASYTGVADASSIVGSHATRANGTIGGNVMNASPAMDTGAPLLCHGGVAVLVGPGGERRVPLSELWTGPGRTTAGADELLVAAKLGFVSDRLLREVAVDIDAIEARVRAAVPIAKVLYLEPDIYRPELEGARPATDTIVLKSAD
mgnify:CR=1 FL=1